MRGWVKARAGGAFHVSSIVRVCGAYEFRKAPAVQIHLFDKLYPVRQYVHFPVWSKTSMGR